MSRRFLCFGVCCMILAVPPECISFSSFCCEKFQIEKLNNFISSIHRFFPPGFNCYTFIRHISTNEFLSPSIDTYFFKFQTSNFVLFQDSFGYSTTFLLLNEFYNNFVNFYKAFCLSRTEIVWNLQIYIVQNHKSMLNYPTHESGTCLHLLGYI